ncbi:hypothetical protein N7U66_14715 [Lacinutrix neustonica]|uniref:Uncharacterized protein n=1 Tax=Lacinutrix neustonica TaxID=2980107 RepID=A0A9E8MTQ7_9FLAO|nr:hypothetical protein [Lacinutrix neustonica]WAC01318.1 hypothetical protein N7U66_14715 [Lacinutrix neustonica]
MKTLKIALVSIFSIGLLTAVLPASETELEVKTSKQEITKPAIDLAALIDPTGIKVPKQG